MKDLEKIREFDRWLTSISGSNLVALEIEEIVRLLPQRYFPVAAQFGAPGADILSRVNSRCRVRLASPGRQKAKQIVATDFRSLPFTQRTLDLAILPHTLDFVDDPHALLRELTQTMVPDGHVLITGFQPFSIWGARKWLSFPSDRVPWCGHFFTTSRIQDWLALMGYRVIGGKMMMYRPPVARQRVFERLKLLEKAGDRWWPMFGAVYLIYAQLETMRMITTGAPAKRAQFRPRLAQPAARRVRLPMHVRRQ